MEIIKIMTQFQFWKKEISRNIKISFDQTIGRLDDCFFNLGYDEILSTAEPFAKASLRLLKDLVPDFKYIRIHNIFTGPQGDRKGKLMRDVTPLPEILKVIWFSIGKKLTRYMMSL